MIKAVTTDVCSLPVKLCGIRFKNPFYIASGPVSKSVEHLVRAEECGWGGSSIKLTIDPAPYINREPRYGWWDDSLNFTAEKRLAFKDGLKLMKEGRKATKEIVLLANITYAGDKGVPGWVNMAKRFEDVGAHIIELNMCCPNMSFNVEVSGTSKGGPKTGASLGQNADALQQIVSSIKKVISIPLFVKLTPEGGRIGPVAKACFDAGADVVSGVGNRLGITSFDIYNPTASRYSLQKEVSMSCYCGNWLRPLAMRDIYEIRKLVGKDKVVAATGGIETAEDAIRFAMVGGDLFGVCTAVLVHGFDIIKPIMKGVHEFLDKQNYKSLADVRDVVVGAVRSAPELTLYEGWATMGQRKYAPCKVNCPNNVPAQSYVRLVSDGKYKEAYDMIVSSGPFQSICGRVCPAFCEESCVRGDVDQPIAIREIKRFVMDMAQEQGWKPGAKKAPATGKKVAVVGAGPAGLTSAFYLALAGHKVTVFEKEGKAGGMMRYGIPRFRLPSEVLDGEIKTITGLGVKIHYGEAMGSRFTVEKLQKQGFSAVLIACGAPLGSDIDVAGCGAPGCLSAIDFLKAASVGKPIKPGKRTAVIGGGYTAVDTARTALRLGAEEVFILYRRTKDEMPAGKEEIELAEKEGVRVMYLVSPTEFVVNDGKVEKSKMVNLVLDEADASGRRRPVEVKGTDFSFKLDTVIMAIGQKVDRTKLPSSIRTSSSGTIICKSGSLATGTKGVFAAGDAVTGPATVIEAVNQGKRCAIEIDQFLRGKRAMLKPMETLAEVDRDSVLERPRVIKRDKRVIPVVLAPTTDSHTASAVRTAAKRNPVMAFQTDEKPYTYSIEEAVKEAERCLRCGCGVGCAICYQICNAFAIERKGDGFEIDMTKCHACGMCFQRCPSKVIKMEQGKEVYLPASELEKRDSRKPKRSKAPSCSTGKCR